MSLSLMVAGKSDVGCIRTNNEDNFGYDLRHGIFVVCDGMGGQACGEVASKLGVDTVLNYFRNSAQSAANGNGAAAVTGTRMLAQAVRAANTAIRAASSNDADKSGMGTTIVAMLVRDNSISIAHVGDSRIYLVRNGELKQLTVDHSLVMEQVRRGIITPEQALTSSLQNIILRALGSEDDVEVDVSEFEGAEADVLLLASDGRTKMISDDDILHIVTAAEDVDAACDQLIAATKKNGGEDNVTCLLVGLTREKLLGKFFGKKKQPLYQDSL